jgi:DNA-3-methyladenine glycosylase
MNGADLVAGRTLWIADDGSVPDEIRSGPRVGIDYAGEWAAARPWRFWIAGHPAVSRKERADAPRPPPGRPRR